MFGAPFFVKHVGRCPAPGLMRVTQVYFDNSTVACSNGACSYLFPFEDLVECDAAGLLLVRSEAAEPVREAETRSPT